MKESLSFFFLLCPSFCFPSLSAFLLRFKNRKYTAKVGQDNVNISVLTIFRLAITSLPQDKCLLQGLIIKILQQAFIHSINLKKAGVCQPKYCNNAYVHVVLTNLCSIFSIFKVFFGLVTIYFVPT